LLEVDRMPSRFLSALLLLIVLAGCARRDRNVPAAAPPSGANNSSSPIASASNTDAGAAPTANRPTTIEAYALLEADAEAFVLIASLPSKGAQAKPAGRRRSINLLGRRLDVWSERPLAETVSFTLVGHARDAQCTTKAVTRAVVRLDGATDAYDAYRVTPCASPHSFFAVRGSHDVTWIQPEVTETSSPKKDVVMTRLTLDGVDARITARMTIHKDRQCTHATGHAVVVDGADGSSITLDDASVRGGVTIERATIMFLYDPRNPELVQGVRVAGGHVERVFRAEVDNRQDGVDCVRDVP
jgi:hypothetical protein